jgi:error-prone DNA polymerase
VREVLARTLGVPIFQEQVMKLAIVAAGFTPGEADGLRRSMAAWRRKGGIGAYGQKLIAGMTARGYPAAFAQQIFQQIHGFAEYGFPESHAASFALLAYASAWLKCHEPAAFACALLNSQPMGFYGPSQLVQDARHHGVEVRGVDVLASGWDCSLESGKGEGELDSARRNPTFKMAGGGCAVDFAEPSLPLLSTWREGEERVRRPHQPALRLGLRLVKGVGEEAARRLVAAREEKPFGDVQDLALRSRLSRRDLKCLADAGALVGLSGHRRRARWAVLGTELAPLPLFRGLSVPEPDAALPEQTPVEELDSDYESLGLTLGPHPLALLRTELSGRNALSSVELESTPHGRKVRTAGLVVCRQRPETASGVTFVTLEDEGGFINLIISKELAEKRRRALVGARLLGVAGTFERLDGVRHVLATELEDLSPLLRGLKTSSRDFC